MTMKFKVVGAPHTERGRQTGNDVNGNPIFAEVTYNRGEVVETDIDLGRKFNPKGSPGMAKFVRLADTAKATYKPFSRFNKNPVDGIVVEEDDNVEPVHSEDEVVEDSDGEEPYVPTSEDDESEGGGIGEDTLSSMTVAELRLHANAEGIDLHGLTTKAQILNKLRNTGGI